MTPSLSDTLIVLVTYLLTYLLIYLLTYLLHTAASPASVRTPVLPLASDETYTCAGQNVL